MNFQGILLLLVNIGYMVVMKELSNGAFYFKNHNCRVYTFCFFLAMCFALPGICNELTYMLCLMLSIVNILSRCLLIRSMYVAWPCYGMVTNDSRIGCRIVMTFMPIVFLAYGCNLLGLLWMMFNLQWKQVFNIGLTYYFYLVLVHPIMDWCWHENEFLVLDVVSWWCLWFCRSSIDELLLLGNKL